MDQTLEALRYYHYSYKTEAAYCQCIRRYIRFFGGNTYPKELNSRHTEKHLSYLDEKDKVAASTQHQALNALVFLYRKKGASLFLTLNIYCWRLSYN